MKEVRWGIIGCGNVTEIKSGPALQLADGSKLVAVMRRDGKLAADYAARHNVGKSYDDADLLINDPEVDAVYIATPPSSHRDYTIAVANAGKPVYVEKPMACNFQQCQEMIQVCQDNGVPLLVAYYRRALPRFKKVKALLDSGAIGKVRFANCMFHRPGASTDNDPGNWRVNPAISGGGYFYDLASHSIDLLQHFLGDAIAAKGFRSNQGKSYPACDMVSGIYLTDQDIHVSFSWNFNAGNAVDETIIIGDQGRLSFSTFGEMPVVLTDTSGNVQEFNIPNPRHIQQPLIQTIVNQLHGKGQCPSTGVTAAQTNWVMDQLSQD